MEDKLKKDQSKKDEGTQVTLQNHNRFTVGISFNSAAVQLTKEWVEKSGQLVQELEKYRDEALRLDRLNEQVSGKKGFITSSSEPKTPFKISSLKAASLINSCRTKTCA